MAWGGMGNGKRKDWTARKEGRKDRPNRDIPIEWIGKMCFFWMLMVVRNSFEVFLWWYWLYMKKERRDWTGYASRCQAYIVESYWHLIIADTTVIMLSTFHKAWSKLRQSEVVQTDPQTMADTAILAQETAILAQERVEVILLWDTWCILLFPSCWNWYCWCKKSCTTWDFLYKTLLKSGKKTSYSTGSPENLPSTVGRVLRKFVPRRSKPAGKTKEAKEQYQIVPWRQLSLTGNFRSFSVSTRKTSAILGSNEEVVLIQTTNINLQDYSILLLLEFRSQDNFEYFDVLTYLFQVFPICNVFLAFFLAGTMPELECLEVMEDVVASRRSVVNIIPGEAGQLTVLR